MADSTHRTTHRIYSIVKLSGHEPTLGQLHHRIHYSPFWMFVVFVASRSGSVGKQAVGLAVYMASIVFQ